MHPIGARLDAILAALPPRISHVVRPFAASTPGGLALVEPGRAWTYGALARAIAETKDHLVRLGIRPGDRVMIVGENDIVLAALLLAAAELDAWAIVANARLSPREIDEIRAHGRPRRAFYALGVSPQAAAHAARAAAETAELGSLGAVGVGPLDDAVEPEPVREDGAEQVAVLLYTSGTTGRPKGVMLTHRNLLFVAAVSGGMRRLTSQDQVYGVLPISHVFGLASVFLGSLLHGSALHLRPRFDPADVVASLARERLSVLQGVPAMFARLLEHLRVNRLESVPHPALRFISAGGAPLDPAVKNAVETLLGLPLNNGYGLTECAPTIAQTWIEAPRGDCSVGPLLPGIEAKLLGTDGGVGELWVRGPGVMKGYYRAPDETRAVLDRDGWLNTGDLARFEGDNLFIVGRSKELIIRSGFNVYPPEVEAVLNAHPDVTQSAVVGRRVPGNEEVVAFVQLLPGAKTTSAALLAFAAERLAPYKRPSEIVLLTALPAGSTGKILKSKLAELAQGRAARTA